jgi:hypothetical protein
MSFAPGNDLILLGTSHGDDQPGKMLIWSVSEKKFVYEMSIQAGPVERVAISADGKHCAAIVEDKVLLYDWSEFAKLAKKK